MKMLLLAINAKYIHSNPAIYSLKAYADREYQGIVTTKEYTINNSANDILRGIYEEAPDILGISCYIWNIDMVERLLTDIPSLLPNTDIWLGGPEVCYHTEDYLKSHPLLKGIMTGEGELLITRLIGMYLNNNMPAGQLVLRAEDEHSAPLNMNDIPFIYYQNIESFHNRIIYYESSRGCPYRCSYCLSSIDKSTRFRDINHVKQELKYFLDKNVRQVKFVDRTFNCDRARADEIWQFLIDNDNGYTNFHFEIAADIMNDSSIDILNRMSPGLVQLEIGVQTTNKDTLQAINRVQDIRHVRDIVSRLNAPHNIHLHLDLIAGLPYEDIKSFRNSFNEVYSMEPCQLQLGFLKVLKGTDIEKQAAEYNIKYSGHAPYEVMSTTWLSYDDISLLKDIEEVLETYYNSAQFTITLPYLAGFFETPYDMYKALALFYRRNDYFVKVPARSRKYEILLEFAKECTEADGQLLTEKLTIDYYLREKPKKKPSFAGRLPENIIINYDETDPITGNHPFNVISNFDLKYSIYSL